MQNLSFQDGNRYSHLFGSVPDYRFLQFSYAPQSTFKAYREGTCSIGYRRQIGFFDALISAGKAMAEGIKFVAQSIFKSCGGTHIANKVTLFIAVRITEVSLGLLIMPFNREFGSYLFDEGEYNLKMYLGLFKHIFSLLEKKASEQAL